MFNAMDEKELNLLVSWGSTKHGQTGQGNCSGDVAAVSEAATLSFNHSSARNSKVKTVACGSSHTVAVTGELERHNYVKLVGTSQNVCKL